MPLHQNADKLGLYPPSAADIAKPADALWGHDDLSPDALALGRFLTSAACEVGGEVFAWLDDAAATCGITREGALQAIDDLAARRIIADYAFHAGDRGLMLVCSFDLDASAYYGDDTAPEADWEDGIMFVGDEWVLPGYDYYTCEFTEARWDPLRVRVYAKTFGQCFYCVEAKAEHLDHMMPRSRNGGDEEENLIGACPSCNSQKRDRTVEEYRALLAYKRRVPDVRMIRFYGEAVTQ